jgi:hypothetical protein
VLSGSSKKVLRSASAKVSSASRAAGDAIITATQGAQTALANTAGAVLSRLLDDGVPLRWVGGWVGCGVGWVGVVLSWGWGGGVNAGGGGCGGGGVRVWEVGLGSWQQRHPHKGVDNRR